MADKNAKAQEDKHVIKPQTTTPAADTSDWPLLLKNYDKRAPSCQFDLDSRLDTPLTMV